MASKDRRVPPELRRYREYVKWSEELGRAICERLARGEKLVAVCREPGMPTAEAVAKWERSKPSFAAELTWARRLGRREKQSRWSAETICAEMSEEIFRRLCEGDSMSAICRDPLMPSQGTIMRWRQRFAAFDELVQLGMRVRAERACDEGWEMALAATPETAYLTDVRLKQLRWMAGVMAPRVYRIRQVEPEAARERLDVLIRTFKAEIDPVTGEERMVALCPDPRTGRAEREDQPGWEPPDGAVLIPA